MPIQSWLLFCLHTHVVHVEENDVGLRTLQGSREMGGSFIHSGSCLKTRLRRTNIAADSLLSIPISFCVCTLSEEAGGSLTLRGNWTRLARDRAANTTKMQYRSKGVILSSAASTIPFSRLSHSLSTLSFFSTLVRLFCKKNLSLSNTCHQSASRN